MGYRTTMFPDHYDEDWSHKTNGIHRFPQKVRLRYHHRDSRQTCGFFYIIIDNLIDRLFYSHIFFFIYLQCSDIQRLARRNVDKDFRRPGRGKNKKKEKNPLQPLNVSILHCIKYLFQTFYNAGDYIIRQGARGDTFFIINKGKVSKRCNSKT